MAGVDFFVSHAGRDQAWAEWIAWHLVETDGGGHRLVPEHIEPCDTGAYDVVWWISAEDTGQIGVR